MRKTPNYNMNLPDGTDYYNIEQFNENATITDTTMHNLQASIAANASEIQTMKQTFQAGVEACYDACVTKGSTPASYALSDVVQGILDIEGQGTLVTKTITQNGTYNAIDDNADGYSSVIVNCSGVDWYGEVEPQITNLNPISSGNTREILNVYYVLDEATRPRFYSTLNFTTSNISSSATVTITYTWDEVNTSSPITQTYTTNGSQILMLDYLLPVLSAGDHTFSLTLGITGGDIS